MDRAALRPVLLTLGAAALFGAATPIGKALLASIGSFRLAGLLYLGAAASVVPAVVRRGLPDFRLVRRDGARLAGIVLFGGILAPVLLLGGLSHAPAASVSLWLTLEPLATAILAWLVFREHVHRRTWASLLLILGSSVVLAWPGGMRHGTAVVLVGLACLCWGIDNNLTSLVDGLTPSQTTLVKGSVAGIVNLGLGAIVHRETTPASLLGTALLVGALCYGVSLVLYIAGAQQLGATRSQLVFSTAPFWGAAVAWTVFSEPVLPAQIAAGVTMGIALWLLQGERHEHAHSHGAVRHLHWHRHDDLHHAHPHDAEPPPGGHTHEHAHEPTTHSHPHRPDLEHRHRH